MLTMSETIDLTPLSLVNTSCFVLSEDGSNTPIVVLHGATALGSDGTSLTIQMSEAHRVAAVLASGTPGGDGSGVKLNILKGGVRDISTLENLVQANLTLTEVADVRSPQLISQAINYDSGILTLTFSETMDVTPSTKVRPTSVFIGQTSNLADAVQLTEATATTTDSGIIKFELTESQRSAAIKFSAFVAYYSQTASNPAVLRINGTSSFEDLSGNVFNADQNLVAVNLDEIQDSTPPFVLSCSLNYSTGSLEITFSEIVNFDERASADGIVNGKLHLDEIFLSNVSGISIASKGTYYHDRAHDHVQLYSVDRPATFVNGNDNEGQVAILLLTEEQRILAQSLSGVAGGDGGQIFINFKNETIADIAGNELLQQFGIAVNESPDVIAPSVTSTVTLDLNNGKLTVKVDETVDVNPTSLLDLSKIHIENVTNDAFVTLTGAQSVVSSENEVFTVYLNEQQRVNAIEKSSQPGGDGTQLLIRIEEEAIADMAGLRNKQLFMFSLSEIADTTRPAFVSATLNFSTGTLVISMTETIDTTPISLITASRYSLKHSYGETITLSGSTPTAFDSTSVTLTMTEDVRARVLRISAMRGA